MNSHLLKLAKNIIVLTLILGFFAVPLAPVLAEDISSSEVVVSEPVSAQDVVAEQVINEPVIVVVDEAVELSEFSEIDAKSTATTDALVEVLLDVNPVLSMPDDSLDNSENNFLTLSEDIPSLIEDGAGEESNFSTLPGELINLDNLAISEENEFVIDIQPVEDNLSQGEELSFLTLIDPVLPADAVIGNENSFTTLPIVLPATPELSSEYSFVTLEGVVNLSAVSGESFFVTLTQTSGGVGIGGESSFNTLDSDHGDGDPVASGESSFITLNNIINNIAVGGESSFVTLVNPDDDNFTIISEEMSFITLGGGNDDGANISGEYNFVTQGSGGGGGSSSGGGSSATFVPVEKPWVCELFLKKFIKYGADNDRREVAKLQAFLRVFEGFSNLRVTGYYDLETFKAVEIFQERYSRDVLGPWGIGDSTGYVYITTTLTINNIYCNRDTRNGLDLRDIFAREYEQVMGEPFDLGNDVNGYTIATETPTTSTESVVKRNWLLAGLGNLFDFVGDNLCWLLNLLLLLVIFFLLWLLWLAGRDKQEEEETLVAGKIVDNSNITNASLGMVSAVALEELMTEEDEAVLAEIAKEEDEEAEILNNDPDQETLLSK